MRLLMGPPVPPLCSPAPARAKRSLNDGRHEARECLVLRKTVSKLESMPDAPRIRRASGRGCTPVPDPGARRANSVALLSGRGGCESWAQATCT